jgi:hypothetical protein
MGLGMNLSMDLRIQNNLGDTPAIPQINKYNPTMVTSSQHPTHQGDRFSNIIHCKIITGMTPFESPHGFHLITPQFL